MTAAEYDSLDELLFRKEPLHPELEARKECLDGMWVVRHPLVYSVPHAEGFNALLNANLFQKKEALKQALLDRKFSRYVFLHERPWRLDALLEVVPLMTDPDYWQLLRQVYQDSENVEQNPALWRKALTAQKSQRTQMMNVEELNALEQLPEKVTVWRGATDDEELSAGYSWTVRENVAHWFASRLARSSDAGIVACGVARKERVIAHLLSRNEFEIIALPEDVLIQKVMPARHVGRLHP